MTYRLRRTDTARLSMVAKRGRSRRHCRSGTDSGRQYKEKHDAIRFFFPSAFGSESVLEDMNTFIRSHRVIHVVFRDAIAMHAKGGIPTRSFYRSRI